MFKNTEEFRTEALHYREFGCYTKLPIGSTSWRNYWKEQRRRCLEGHKSSDGTYITGYHYHFLNFSPILQTVVVKESEDEFGQNQAARVKDFPKFLDGQYEMFHYFDEAEKGGEHAFMLGSRGRGKSLMTASMCVRNYHHIRDSNSYCIASNEGYLLKDGIISKAWDLMNFVDQNTVWQKRRHEHDEKLHRRASVKITTSSGIKTIDPRSYNSNIIGTTVGDDIEKLRGIRGKLIVVEEIGNFKNLLKAWNIMRPSMEAGKNTFGLILGIGTGGEEGANFEGAEQLFKNPEAFNIHGITNKWDVGLEGKKCAFFYPADLNYEGAMDKNGNSDREKARKLIQKDRDKVAKSSDPHALVRRCAEIPLTPTEAMMRISGTLFPILELRKQEGEIEANPHKYKNAEFHVNFELDRDTQKFKWVPDTESVPLYELNSQDNKNMYGCVVVYEHPKTDEKENVFENRYIFGIDSYDLDSSSTTSLGSMIGMDSWTGRVVVEYSGRPKTAFEFYEKCRRILLYYNGRANVENLNKGIFDYMDSKGCGYLLTEELRISREALNENSTLTRRRGTTPSKPLNAYARGLVAQYLLESTNNPDKPEEINVHKLRCLPLVKELILWHIDGNFDRVSAFMMLMLLYYEKKKYMMDGTYQLTKSTIADDPYLQKIFKNYNKTFGRY